MHCDQSPNFRPSGTSQSTVFIQSVSCAPPPHALSGPHAIEHCLPPSTLPIQQDSKSRLASWLRFSLECPKRRLEPLVHNRIYDRFRGRQRKGRLRRRGSERPRRIGGRVRRRHWRTTSRHFLAVMPAQALQARETLLPSSRPQPPLRVELRPHRPQRAQIFDQIFADERTDGWQEGSLRAWSGRVGGCCQLGAPLRDEACSRRVRLSRPKRRP